jgi:hypothetical protein
MIKKYRVVDDVMFTIIQGNDSGDYRFFGGDPIVIVVDFEKQTIYLEADGRLYESTNTLAVAQNYINQGALKEIL